VLEAVELYTGIAEPRDLDERIVAELQPGAGGQP
jgi:hypothetical protein